MHHLRRSNEHHPIGGYFTCQGPRKKFHSAREQTREIVDRGYYLVAFSDTGIPVRVSGG